MIAIETKPMTPPLDLDGLEALLAKATPGPWAIDNDEGVPFLTSAASRKHATLARYGVNNENNDADFALIATLRNAAPQLLAIARKHKALVERIGPWLQEHATVASELWREDQIAVMDSIAVRITRELHKIGIADRLATPTTEATP